MPAKTIAITITAKSDPPPYSDGTTVRANNGFWISVSEDQADLTHVHEGHGANNPNAHIKWRIVTQGWEFPDDGGIVFDSPGTNFTDKLRDPTDKKLHSWQREAKDNFADPKDPRFLYKYTIEVTDTAHTVIYDPWVINK